MRASASTWREAPPCACCCGSPLNNPTPLLRLQPVCHAAIAASQLHGCSPAAAAPVVPCRRSPPQASRVSGCHMGPKGRREKLQQGWLPRAGAQRAASRAPPLGGERGALGRLIRPPTRSSAGGRRAPPGWGATTHAWCAPGSERSARSAALRASADCVGPLARFPGWRKRKF